MDEEEDSDAEEVLDREGRPGVGTGRAIEEGEEEGVSRRLPEGVRADEILPARPRRGPFVEVEGVAEEGTGIGERIRGGEREEEDEAQPRGRREDRDERLQRSDSANRRAPIAATRANQPML